MITGFNTDIDFEGKTYHVQTEDKGLAKPVILSLIYDRGTILASKRSPYDDLIVDKTVDDNVLAERLNKQHRLICAAVRKGRIDDLIRMTSNAATKKAAEASHTASVAATAVVEDVAAADILDFAVIPVVAPPDIPLVAPPAIPSATSEGEGIEPLIERPIDLDLNSYEIIEEEIILPDEAVEIVSEMIGKERPVNNNLTVELLGDSKFKGGEHKTVTFMVCRGTQRKVIADAQVMVKILGSTFRPMIFHARTDVNGVARVNLQFPSFAEGRAALLVRAASDGDEVELRRIVAHG